MRILLSSIPSIPVVATGFVVDANLAAVIAAAAGTVGITMIVVGWVDRRIDHKIRNYAHIVRVQHMIILREISGFRELLGHPPLNIPEILKNEDQETG